MFVKTLGVLMVLACCPDDFQSIYVPLSTTNNVPVSGYTYKDSNGNVGNTISAVSYGGYITLPDSTTFATTTTVMNVDFGGTIGVVNVYALNVLIPSNVTITSGTQMAHSWVISGVTYTNYGYFGSDTHGRFWYQQATPDFGSEPGTPVGPLRPDPIPFPAGPVGAPPVIPLTDPTNPNTPD